MSQALEDDRRADVYSIYFSFNSDLIREESEPTLEEIAGLLAARDWRWLEGHTDGIGGDGNSVSQDGARLPSRTRWYQTYSIDAQRLTTGGFGESRPKDTNDTLEGRARNRRVELVRLP